MEWRSYNSNLLQITDPQCGERQSCNGNAPKFSAACPLPFWSSLLPSTARIKPCWGRPFRCYRRLSVFTVRFLRLSSSLVRRSPRDNNCATSVDKYVPLNPFRSHPCFSVDTLGYFSLFTNLSYALCLPFWGWLVHRYTVQNAHNILCLSCFLWGAATLSIARSETVLAQAFFRSLNGGALASILPLSQMMLVDLVPPSMRGSAFGLMGFLEKIAATLATSAVIWYDDWRIPYYVVGSISVLMAFSAKRYLRMKTKIKMDDASSGDDKLSLLGIVKRISRIPAFVYLVAQGVFGAIPWDMMSFVLLLLEWKNFTKEQIISFSVFGGIFGTVGAFLGGVLGDYFAHLPDGRVNVALVSVLLGILFYGLFLYSETYRFCILFHSMFHLTGGWCPAAALRSVSRECF